MHLHILIFLSSFIFIMVTHSPTAVSYLPQAAVLQTLLFSLTDVSDSWNFYRKYTTDLSLLLVQLCILRSPRNLLSLIMD